MAPPIDQQHATAHAKMAGKHLTFRLANEAYGVPVLNVREIIRLSHITTVPQMPAEVKGVINLRGKIIPVVDLRIKFGMPETDTTARSCIVVVNVKGMTGVSAHIGLLVDDVQEVTHISESDVEPAPDLGASVNSTYISGVAKLKSGVTILLDLDAALSCSPGVPAPALA